MLPGIQHNKGQTPLSKLFVILSLGLLIAIGSVLAACGSSSGSSSSPTPTVSAQVQKCGTVQSRPNGTLGDPTAAKQAEDCFYQAFKKCQPASLIFSASGVDTIAMHTFTIQNNGEQCTITDAVQHQIVPAKPSAAKTFTCSGVTQKPDGLHFSACGADGDVVVPVQATH